MVSAFVEAGVLFAAAYSSTGAARDFLKLALSGRINLAEASRRSWKSSATLHTNPRGDRKHLHRSEVSKRSGPHIATPDGMVQALVAPDNGEGANDQS